MKTLCIMVDSFVVEDKVKSEVGYVPRQHLPMFPHANKGPMLGQGEIYRIVRVENLSMGGATMKKMLGKKELMVRWVSEVPALTVVHLGACDIGNKGINDSSSPAPTKQYREKLYYFLDTWIKRATKMIEEHHYGNVAIIDKMEERIKTHK